MTKITGVRDHFLPQDRAAFRSVDHANGRVVVIAPTRAACETIELAIGLEIATVLEREHGDEIRDLARADNGFGIVASTGTGKTLAIRSVAEEILGVPLVVGVVNREREATPETPKWNVVIVTTGIARRWFQGDLISQRDTIVVDEIHQTSAELELCLALGKRVGCRFIWLSATVDPAFYRKYLNSETVLETSAFDPNLAARVTTHTRRPADFFDDAFLRRIQKEDRGVAVFLPTRAEVEALAQHVGKRWKGLNTAFYHGGQPIRVIRPFLDGKAKRPFLLAMTAAGQSALNIQGLDTVVIYDARYVNIVDGGRNVLTRQYLGANELLQMAGRVHGRVQGGEVTILTDRDIHFEVLQPVPPVFQLGGDSERVALTAAAIGIDLSDLDLPEPLDLRAYRIAVKRLTERGIINDGRLTPYGRDIEALPVDRRWGEMLVHSQDDLLPFLAAMANIDSLHRMTRDKYDLSGLLVGESDHLTSYNVFADAVNEHGYLGKVYGLQRHLFRETIDAWAEERGVLVKAIEDTALGMSSVYRALEIALPECLSLADSKTLRKFRRVLAEWTPFDLVIDEQLADGGRAHVARESLCGRWGAVTGTLRYFSGRFGTTRAVIEGTSFPRELILSLAHRTPPHVEYGTGSAAGSLFAVQVVHFAGFELDCQRKRLPAIVPFELVDSTRKALVDALVSGVAQHPDQKRITAALNRLGEYWRRSGGSLASADPAFLRSLLMEQLDTVGSIAHFKKTRVTLDVTSIVGEEDSALYDGLPSSAMIVGDRVPLDYEIETGRGVVRLRLRRKQAMRLREKDLPEVDRPLRFTVTRGKRSPVRASSLVELQDMLNALAKHRPGGRSGGRAAGRRRRY